MTKNRVDSPTPGVEELYESFQDRSLLRLAFTHGSYSNEHPDTSPESNERLEFLGDALVGLALAEEIFRRCPRLKEGQLTAIRSSLARGDTLARAADTLGLGDRLLMGKGEETGGGRCRPSNLAAAFEALVGALFLDQGYRAAHEFVVNTLSDELSSAVERPSVKDAKSLLQELAQGRGQGLPCYRVHQTSSAHDPERFEAEAVVSGQVAGRGTGRRKTLAEQAAAGDALERLIGS